MGMWVTKPKGKSFIPIYASSPFMHPDFCLASSVCIFVLQNFPCFSPARSSLNSYKIHYLVFGYHCLLLLFNSSGGCNQLPPPSEG